MPGMLNKDEIITNPIIGNLPKENNETVSETVREITQNDHINKKLLVSFLDRINQTIPPITQENEENSNNQTEEFS